MKFCFGKSYFNDILKVWLISENSRYHINLLVYDYGIKSIKNTC